MSATDLTLGSKSFFVAAQEASLHTKLATTAGAA